MGTTTHNIYNSDSRDMSMVPDKSVSLIITSPPYPMIEMWDNMFIAEDNSIKDDLSSGQSFSAFRKMHLILNETWRECDRVLMDNGFICINIGDATRTVNDSFQLFSNHTQIINFFSDLGYSVLPDVHWRKQSNAPNKFMGSGMYPAGAYVTYEHEYILIFRKGVKRQFSQAEKALRKKSAFFWEERNVWFSDLWDIKGTSQILTQTKATRERNASFPFEIPYRLVNMYSAEGDTVLDPFTGLGTTNLACLASQRNSIGFEIDCELASLARASIMESSSFVNTVINNRLLRHIDFINSLPDEKRKKCYKNAPHGFDVKTRQEIDIKIDKISDIHQENDTIVCLYA